MQTVIPNQYQYYVGTLQMKRLDPGDSEAY